jgi:hypothetical protein
MEVTKPFRISRRDAIDLCEEDIAKVRYNSNITVVQGHYKVHPLKKRGDLGHMLGGE